MQGIPYFNFPAFHDAAGQLREEGWEIFNPAERDEDIHGKDVSNSATGSLDDIKDSGFSLRDALGADTHYICQSADAIFMLPGWENSKGAFAEWALARALGLEIYYLEEQGEGNDDTGTDSEVRAVA